MKKRGIIVRPSQPEPYRYSIDPSYLRYCLLYWDKIDCPDAALLEAPFISNRPDLVHLQELGILRRTRGFFFSKDGDDPVLMRSYDEYPEQFWTVAQLYAFIKNNCEEESWYFGNSGRLFQEFSTDIPDQFYFVERPPFRDKQSGNILALQNATALARGRGLVTSPSIEVELFNILPIPSEDTRIDEILEFKEARKDELSRLRHAIDGLCVDILNSNDIPRAENYVIDEISQSLRDLGKVTKKRAWKRVLSTISIKLDISKLVYQSLMGGFLGSSVDLPIAGAVVGAATSLIKFSLDPKALKPDSIPDSLRDYQYVFDVSRELG